MVCNCSRVFHVLSNFAYNTISYLGELIRRLPCVERIIAFAQTFFRQSLPPAQGAARQPAAPSSQKTADIHSLPNELLPLIFSHLTISEVKKWALTCQKARKQAVTIIANNSKFLNQRLMTFQPGDWQGLKKFLESCEQSQYNTPVRLVFTEKDNLSFCTIERGITLAAGHWLDYLPDTIKTKFPNIEEYKAHSLTVKKFTHLISNLKNLKHVSLEMPTYFRINEDVAIESFPPNTILETINLTNLFLNKNGLTALLTSSPHLHSLSLRSCVLYDKSEDVTNRFPYETLPSASFEQVDYPQSLKRLDLEHSDCTDRGVLHILKTLPNLESLNLGLSRHIVGQGFPTASPHTGLKELSLRTNNISVAQTTDILRHFPALEKLVIYCYPPAYDQALQNIFLAPTLQEITLNFGEGSQESFLSIFARCPNLRKLNCLAFGIIDFNGETLVQAQPHAALEEMNLHNSVSDQIFTTLFAIFPNLKRLLSNARLVTGLACADWPPRRGVEELHLKNCESLSNKGFLALLRVFPDLKKLSLNGNVLIDDETFAKAAFPASLRSVNLTYTKFKIKGLVNLLKCCPNLESLYFGGVEAFSEEALEIMKARPSVKLYVRKQ